MSTEIVIELSDFHYTLLQFICEHFPEYHSIEECFSELYLSRIERMIESDADSLIVFKKKIEKIMKEVVEKKQAIDSR